MRRSTGKTKRRVVAVPVGATRALRLLLRALTLFVALQLSGVASAAVELGWCDDPSECCADCPVEKNGDECPPGCPNCHCSHGNVALPPAFEAPPTWTARAQGLGQAPPYEASVPRAPPLSSVYRPPRTTFAVV